MDRLTHHWANNYVAIELNYDFLWEMPEEDYKHFNDIIKKLARYEDLEEEGRLVILSVEDIHPCKICDAGWGYITSNSSKSCYENCGKLREYKKKYNL